MRQCGGDSPIAACRRIDLRARSETPFAIKTGEESTSAVKKFEQFGFVRMRNRPTAMTSKEAILVGKLRHHAILNHAVQPNDSLTPGVAEEMVKNMLQRSW